jgi:hypothetical protein
MNTLPYLIMENSLTVFLNGKTHNVTDGHPNYAKIRDALRQKQFDAIEALIDVPTVINRFGQGKVAVANGVVSYNGTELHNSLTRRILKMVDEGFDVAPMVAFLENLMQNPSKRAVDELYGFLEVGNLPITEDGYFLAYKRVRSNYMDIHSGKFDNSVGKVCEMPRNMVDEDKSRTCSQGLHFCSLAYLPNFSSNGSQDHIMIVKINPRDVVAIPADYNDTKGRTCRYEVVGEHTKGDDADTKATTSAFTKSVYTPAAAPAAPKAAKRTVMSVADAAKAMGITASAVCKRADRGVTVAWNGDDEVEILDPSLIKVDTTSVKLYTREEAAAALGISRSALNKRLQRGISAQLIRIGDQELVKLAD